MMSLFGSFTRIIFICTIIIALSHDAVVAAASSADADSDDTSSMKSCEKLAPLWTSTPYTASVMYANGDTKSIIGLQANLTITSQAGCKAIAINSWTNGMVSECVYIYLLVLFVCLYHTHISIRLVSLLLQSISLNLCHAFYVFMYATVLI